MQLTQKERNLLQDQLHHEEVCIQKYQSYAQQAQDPQLKQLFTQYANQEQQHYNTISQLLGRQPQQVNQLQNQGQQLQSGVQGKAKDALLCNDMLMTEKYVSNAYDTTIFEATKPELRQQLQHIQQEEQQHGEGIFNYMQQHGMYRPNERAGCKPALFMSVLVTALDKLLKSISAPVQRGVHGRTKAIAAIPQCRRS